MAAVDLSTEQGYDATTVAQIAERAGVTKSTFFRYFPDKRELLVAGQETLSRLLTEGIAEAPDDVGPLEAAAAGLERASSAMGPMNRELAPRLKAAVAASVELQERDALKTVSLAAAMTAALVARGLSDPAAALAEPRHQPPWTEHLALCFVGRDDFALRGLCDAREQRP
ncbi:TetR/AcrR family transcriptional regulator [Streptomyces sp. NRRL F-5135]|uniref:TetR/AcrR family transcriptional regulator n=1 Tax=Streptomyces sp. NRRL F-5135 TaxID=1463858 RepID=UPI00099CB623|nr:TetR/AcrR family transcriptional regulator [Streptomyces sp. NRRL F-5135]